MYMEKLQGSKNAIGDQRILKNEYRKVCHIFEKFKRRLNLWEIIYYIIGHMFKKKREVKRKSNKVPTVIDLKETNNHEKAHRLENYGTVRQLEYIWDKAKLK